MVDSLIVNEKHKIRSHSKVLIIGSGDSALCVIRLLKNCPEIPANQIKIVSASSEYHYQSFQTLVEMH